MTIHFDNQCLLTDDVKAMVPTETHSQKRQPHKIVRGWYKKIIHSNTKTIIL